MPQVSSDTRTAFVAVMKAVGFRRQRSFWVLPLDQTSIVTHLQRSQFSKECFFNVGLWINSEGEPQTPWRSQIPGRAEIFIPERRASIQELLNDETDLPLAERQTRLQHLVEDDLLPALAPYETLDGMRTAWATIAPPGLAYTVVAQKILGLPSGSRFWLTDST